jgi:hypothetical protein
LDFEGKRSFFIRVEKEYDKGDDVSNKSPQNKTFLGLKYYIWIQ